MKDLTIIVPITELTKEESALFDKAIESAKKHTDNIIVIGSKNTLNSVNTNGLTTIENEENTEFSPQVNKAVENVKTKYFSILEFDDYFNDIWSKNVEKQIEMGEDISLYLPLTEVVDYKNLDKGSIGYVNEVVWASSFSDNIGYLDLECVEAYPNFNLTGGVFKTEDFKSVGGLKPSIKLSYWFEFLLRFLYNGKKAYVIPKVGYVHFLSRPNSVSDNYTRTMKEEEAEWWMNLAKKEYFFKKDRNKTYDE